MAEGVAARSGDPSAEIERLRLENETLSAVVGVVASGPDLVHILDRVVDLLTKATDSHACFVYLPSAPSLVLRAASPIYSHLVGKISFGIDEGLAGWVMKEREPAFIREGAIADPRTVYVPELEEERFQSMVAVPISSRSGSSIGAIVLHTVAPREFDEGIINVLFRAASLVSGAIANARLYEEARERVEELTRLSRLGGEIASVSDRASLFEVAAGGITALAGASACRIYELEADGSASRVMAIPAFGRDQEQDLGGAEAEALEALRGGDDSVGAVSAALGLEDCRSAISLPLTSGQEQLGLIAVGARTEWSNSSRELMRAAARQISLALEKIHLIERLTGENAARDLFDALATEEPEPARTRAAAAGIDLQQPHLLVAARPLAGAAAQAPGRSTEELELAIQRINRGAAYHQGAEAAHALLQVSASGPEPARRVAARLREIAAANDLAVGLSEARSGLEGARRGLREADDAARIGASVLTVGDAVIYRDTGAYRYMIGLLDSEGPGDHLGEAIERLAAYDRERQSQLLLTLDVYLAEGRSIAAAARKLWIHANTLRQRLERIEVLTGMKLLEEDLLSLHLAVKLALARFGVAPNSSPGRSKPD
ncbi:MAG TPA: GAF domain-containing protein [Solirubrobacterales bacterium]|nr:GAF domain-containing protein [Solirubrobacterales bacterium]